MTSICDNLGQQNLRPPYITTVSWDFDGSCPASTDLSSVRIYALVDSAGSGRTLLAELPWPQDSLFRISDSLQIARCYGLTAVDSIGNEGPLSDIRCVSNCPFYELPNVFTPNGDNQHDVLRPRINRFVARVDLQVFDRWGVKVYQTEDPTLGWDATTLGGEPVSDGTYHYICRVFEQTADGGSVEVDGPPLSGFIEVVRETQP